MSDIAIEFRVKNGRLKRAILAKWESYAQFCRANHLRYGALNDLLGMRKPAYNLDGWTSNAMDIATALHREPEELWPEEMRRAELHKNSGEFALTMDEAASLAAPQMERLAFGELTKGLRPNELRAVTAFAKGETLDVAGEGIGQHGGNVTRERSRQITLKAIRKMKRNADLKGIRFTDLLEP